MSDYDAITMEDVTYIKAIVKAYYGEAVASRFTYGAVSDETVNAVAKMLHETVDCSKWIDSVPNPSDLLMPTKNLQKWALRVIRAAGKPFLMDNEKVNIMCKVFLANKFKSDIVMSLKY
ncbi:hypothetical protein FT643_22835 [Ketobacter sp. MCCC 1A13808]|uniref:hypothetical protein n=1 Tax=Ketobacter sp. MCCC 1A13808 TaxID=2602738 RepID=UPI0012ECAB99|nr:hypothetical protein [Ketobacter sp. MCCC 1A13808]MVF14965.1 hypothetical protein [Ketobacter sp. MCCC 1A13808]